jgi:hypothetical protein
MEILTEDSSVTIPGMDLGGKAHVVAWNRRDGYLTIKVEGGKYWGGIGQAQRYSPAHYDTYKVLDEVTWEPHPQKIRIAVERVVQHDVRTQPLDLSPRGSAR